jgi:uncharacterized protein YutE (UPF0331/DUF86 family)
VSDRRANLTTVLKKRILDTREQVETLRVACTQFGDDFDETAFVSAWNNSDRQLKLSALAVQAAYENSINGAIRVGQEIAELAGWTTANTDPSSVEALKALRGNGIIPNAKIHQQLKDAYAYRSLLQHDYPNTRARDIYEQARATLDAVPALLQEAHLYVVQNLP